MSKAEAAKQDWTGLIFANNWEIKQKFNCADYKKLYKEATGEDIIVKNAHYLCHNNTCGVDSYLERTVIKRAMERNATVMSKCKGCNGMANGSCHYASPIREKKLTKVPDRSEKVSIGDTFGFFKVQNISSSENFSDHQRRAEVVCTNCGRSQSVRFDHLLSREVSCECFKSHSTGEMWIKKILEKMDIDFITEYSFSDLHGLGGGALRYDFAIMEKDKVVYLIEFDGEQHYQEDGFYTQNGKLQTHDKIKDEYAAQHNIPLLRIPYYEITQAKGLITAFFMGII